MVVDKFVVKTLALSSKGAWALTT